MKKGFTLTAAMALAAVVGIVGAPQAFAQMPTLCQFAAGDFTKTSTLVDVDGSGGATPGDQIDFTVLACNSGAAACTTLMQDDPDTILAAVGLDPNDYTVIPLPPRVGCPTDGAAVCQKGPRGGPYTDVPGMGRCGQDCANPTDALAFQPPGGDTLAPGQCYRWAFRVQIEPTVDATQCFCNQASARRDFVGGTFSSHDPNWATLATPTAPGCADSETCPDTAACRTCVRVEADYDVSTSTKCIRGAATCSGPTSPTVPGTLTYDFTILNSGAAATPANLIFRDPLNFVSSLGSPCIDTALTPTITPTVCSWPGCVPGDYVVVWDPVGEQISSNPPFPPIPAGGQLTFSVTVTIDPAANGDCTNIWQLLSGNPPVPEAGLNQPVFNVAGGPVSISVSKVPSINPAPPGAQVDWTITIANTGTQAANNVTFNEPLPACATLVSCPSTNPPLALNCIPPGPVSPQTTFNIAPGGMQQIVIRTTAGACQATPCVNDITVSGSNFSAVNGSGSFDFQCGATVDVTKSGSPDPVDPAAQLTWTITLTNTSTTDTATGVTFSDTLAPCNTLISCTVSGAPVTCGGNPVVPSAPFSIAPGATVTVTIVTDPSGTGACQNSVNVSGTNIGSTSASDSVEVRPGPSLVVTKTPSVGSVPTGDQPFTWTITIENQGSAAATGVRITDNFPPGECFKAATPPACTSTPNQASLVCGATSVTAGPFDIAAGATQTFTIDVLSGATPGACTNTVNLTGTNISNIDRDGTIQVTAGGCGLLNGDLTALSPVTPAKNTLWTSACAPGDDVLSNTLLPAVNDLDQIDTLGGQPLRYYQLTCGCGQTIYVKRTGTQVIIDF